MGLRSAKLRRSPLTEYCRAGNVTLRALLARRSQIPKPISFVPAIGPSVKCSSASASLPTGFPLALSMILTVIPFMVSAPSEEGDLLSRGGWVDGPARDLGDG